MAGEPMTEREEIERLTEQLRGAVDLIGVVRAALDNYESPQPPMTRIEGPLRRLFEWADANGGQ
jgi:hypothetical protein